MRMGIAAQLRTINTAFETFNKYPELKGVPVIIGESDPEGCAACQGPQFSYRNGTVYSSYTAAVFARKHDLADLHGINLEGAVTWAFTFEDQPYFAGFRQVASNGLPLAVLNVFRMFARMGPERLRATSDAQVPLEAIISGGVRDKPDVGVLASRGPGQVAIMVWHYHDDDVGGAEARVDLQVAGLPASSREARLTHYRVDKQHGSTYDAWLRMGSPNAPNLAQYAELEKAGELATISDAPATLAVANGRAQLTFLLPRQGVSLLVVSSP
jgi:xylan 1,4-beta-xylosidase